MYLEQYYYFNLLRNKKKMLNWTPTANPTNIIRKYTRIKRKKKEEQKKNNISSHTKGSQRLEFVSGFKALTAVKVSRPFNSFMVHGFCNTKHCMLCQKYCIVEFFNIGMYLVYNTFEDQKKIFHTVFFFFFFVLVKFTLPQLNSRVWKNNFSMSLNSWLDKFESCFN